MRVVGYVREVPGPDNTETAFMQSERIRRWADRNGYQLIGVCQDTRTSEEGQSRQGFSALLGIIGSRQADVVVLASLDALSPDKVTQEVMLWELRSLGTGIASSTEEDLTALAEPPVDPARMFIRDILEKSMSYRRRFGTRVGRTEAADTPPPVVEFVVPDVVVEFVDSLPTIDPSGRGRATA
ncbi:MAG: recombinase family protein [Acidimicrobiia bacterium]|nr:recombinase family protein [Acidimicrobiia bacterium]